jgi:hypothetical protein
MTSILQLPKYGTIFLGATWNHKQDGFVKHHVNNASSKYSAINSAPGLGLLMNEATEVTIYCLNVSERE